MLTFSSDKNAFGKRRVTIQRLLSWWLFWSSADSMTVTLTVTSSPQSWKLCINQTLLKCFKMHWTGAECNRDSAASVWKCLHSSKYVSFRWYDKIQRYDAIIWQDMMKHLIPYDDIRYDTVRLYDTMVDDTIWYDTIQWHGTYQSKENGKNPVKQTTVGLCEHFGSDFVRLWLLYSHALRAMPMRHMRKPFLNDPICCWWQSQVSNKQLL